jgi:ATP-dependent helicase/nuclease subunit B
VIGGRDRWRRRLDGLANELRLRLEEADEPERENLVRALDDLAAFKGYALPLIDVLADLPSGANWGEWLDLLGALATQALKKPDRVLALLAELAPMSPVGPVTLTEVLAVMDRLLLEVAVARLGWPAPADTAEAIDEAEYDLALLEGLSARPEESAGAARYLVTVNPHLARALRNRFQRWSRNWTAADGLLNQSETVQAVMAAHKLGARSYSPTALQDYARCPYRFFLRAIHRLSPREVPAAIDELDPLQRGSLFHDAQFELFERLRELGLLPVRSGNLEAAWEQLDAVLLDVAARYQDELAPAIVRVWEDGIASIRSDLRDWLRRASEDDAGYVPWRFELSFGLAGRPERHHKDTESVSLAVPLDCGIQLRGSIDLVELHSSGLARVTDHKTGRPEGKKGEVIRGGKSLQPLLYALAAEKLLAGKAEVNAGRLYFCTSNGGFTSREVVINERTRDLAVQIAGEIGEALSRPSLPAAPEKDGCTYCDYRIVCGPYEEVRSAGKPRERIESLLALRELP